MIKNVLFFLFLSFTITQKMQAQFGIGKAIKDKVEKKKEPEQKATSTAPAEVKKASPTPEEIEAELKKVTFPEKALDDPELEKKMVEVIGRAPKFFSLEDMSQLKILHITSYDWTVKKDKYGNIEGLIMWVCVGYQKDGACHKKEFYFKRDYLGGSEYQKSFLGVIPYSYTTSFEKEMSCEVLNELAAKEKVVAPLKATTTPVVKPANTTTSKTSTTTTGSKPATANTTTTTAKPTALSTMPTQVISLSAIGINAIMTAPKGTIAEEDDMFKTIKKGNTEIQAEETKLTLTEMKTDVKTNSMYNGTGKILATNTNGFIFSCIEEGEDEKRVHLEFFKTIGGKKYRFIDNRLSDDAYTLEELQPFLDALNTIP